MHQILIPSGTLSNTHNTDTQGENMLEYINTNSDTIIAITTILISIISLIVSIFTAKTQNKLTRQSARPFLSLNLVDLNDRISVELINNGLGVAIIRKAIWGSMESGNKSNSLVELVELIDNHAENSHLQERGIWKRYEENLCQKAIAPQAKLFLLELDKNDIIQLNYLKTILSEIELKITYTSIYEKDSYILSDNLRYYDR